VCTLVLSHPNSMQNQQIIPIPKELSHNGTSGYLDIVPTPEGYNHVALFSPVDSDTPRFLTTGDWEVTGGILGVDPLRGLMCNPLLPQQDNETDYFFGIPDSYFRAASPTSIERNIYSVHVPIDAHSAAVKLPTALTDTSVPSYYSASFSPRAGFYLLSYEGPGVPFQKLINVGNESGSSPYTWRQVLLTFSLCSERAFVGGEHGAKQDDANVRSSFGRSFHY